MVIVVVVVVVVVSVVGLVVDDGEVLNPKIVGLGLGVVVAAEAVRLVVNCEFVIVVCAGGAVVVVIGANVKRFGRNIPENPVDMVLPVVMSVASLPSVFVVVVLFVVVVVVVVEAVEVKVVVVVGCRLIPKFSSKSVPGTITTSVVLTKLSVEIPNSSSSVSELL